MTIEDHLKKVLEIEFKGCYEDFCRAIDEGEVVAALQRDEKFVMQIAIEPTALEAYDA